MCTRRSTEYYPATEKTKIPSAVAKCMGMEGTASEVCQAHKDQHCMFLLEWKLKAHFAS